MAMLQMAEEKRPIWQLNDWINEVDLTNYTESSYKTGKIKWKGKSSFCTYIQNERGVTLGSKDTKRIACIELYEEHL